MKKQEFTGSIHCQPKSIVLLARERYGDAILMTPLIKALRHEYPEISIYIIAFTRIIFDFFSTDANITAVYHAKKKPGRYFSEVLLKKFDILFNPKNHPSKSFYLQSRFIRARYKVGHRNTNHDDLYDYLIDLAPGTHESLRNLSLLTALGKTPAKEYRPYIPEMPLSDEAKLFIDKLPTDYCTGINISAGAPGGHRTVEQWSDLVRNFPDEKFIVFSGMADIGEKRALEKLHENIQPSPATKNLYEVWKIVQKLKLLVTPDTSLVHVASCSDTPLVAMYRYNPADSIEFSPLSTYREVLVSPATDISAIENTLVSSALGRMIELL
ncbi:MAG: glycosyltransferase family 9 protein, partial [Chlorobiaceae bacterium]|nr:glycosyltransferase family 9 protein [Chlorobiaceae bacterium]NTV61271.1 glycosyltransferase family 9 protein [Chlorobiaceae bacterium]